MPGGQLPYTLSQSGPMEGQWLSLPLRGWWGGGASRSQRPRSAADTDACQEQAVGMTQSKQQRRTAL